MPDSGCPPTPVSARLTVTNAAGDMVASAVSDTRGHFRIALRPGVYIVAARAMAGGVPRPASIKVTVVAGHMLAVRLTLDSGIR
jgi:hypothetical protein